MILTGYPKMNRQNQNALQINIRLALLMSGLLRRSRFLFPPSRKPLLLVAVVRAGLFLVPLTLVAVEEQDFLSVGTAHTVSLRSWPRAVKGSTLPPPEISPSGESDG